MKEPGFNERREERVAHQIFLQARQVKPTDPKAGWEIYVVKNITKTALFFYSSRRFEPGIELEIKITNPLIVEEGMCWGTVIRCNPLESIKGMFGTALELTKIDNDTRQTIDRTIEFFVKKRKKHAQE